MILSFAIILGFLLIGDTISTIFKLNIPGSVIGMLLLATALWTSLIKDTWINPGAKLLLDHMAFLFVPAGVGLIIHLGMFSNSLGTLVGAIVFSTLATMAITGFVQQLLEKRRNHK